MNLKELVKQCVKTTVRTVKANKAEILTGAACLGVIATAVTFNNAGKEQVEIDKEYIDAKQGLETEEELKKAKKLYIRFTIENYAKPVVASIGTIACILGSNKFHLDEKAAILAALELSKDQFADLKKSISANLTEKQQEAVMSDYKDIQEEKVINNVIDNTVGGYLYKETLSGQFFRATDDRIQKAVIKLNKHITSAWDGYEATLNDWLSCLDDFALTPVETCKTGDVLYFYNEDLGPMGLEVYTDASTSKHRGSGEAYCELTYNHLPAVLRK